MDTQPYESMIAADNHICNTTIKQMFQALKMEPNTDLFMNGTNYELDYKLAQVMTVEDVSREGDCLFDGVRKSISGTTLSSKEIRMRTTQQMKKHPNVYEPFHYDERGDDTFQQYIEKMTVHSEWADHMAIQACADHFNIEIRILMGHPCVDKANIARPRKNEDTVKPPPEIIYLYNHNQQHYMRLAPKETKVLGPEITDVPAENKTKGENEERNENKPKVTNANVRSDDEEEERNIRNENHEASEGDKNKTKEPGQGEQEQDQIKIGNITLDKKEDLNRLNPGEWLNDNIINASLILLVDKMKKTHPNIRIHAYSTHFWTTLTKGGFQKVKRWSRRIHQKDGTQGTEFILIPQNVGEQKDQQDHWTITIVNNQTTTIRIFDSMLTQHGRNTAEQHMTTIKEYLALDRDSYQKPRIEYTTEVIEECQQQGNTSDCGLFIINNARCEIQSRTSDFTQQSIIDTAYRARLLQAIKRADIPLEFEETISGTRRPQEYYKREPPRYSKLTTAQKVTPATIEQTQQMQGNKKYSNSEHRADEETTAKRTANEKATKMTVGKDRRQLYRPERKAPRSHNLHNMMKLKRRKIEALIQKTKTEPPQTQSANHNHDKGETKQNKKRKQREKYQQNRKKKKATQTDSPPQQDDDNNKETTNTNSIDIGQGASRATPATHNINDGPNNTKRPKQNLRRKKRRIQKAKERNNHLPQNHQGNDNKDNTKVEGQPTSKNNTQQPPLPHKQPETIRPNFQPFAWPPPSHPPTFTEIDRRAAQRLYTSLEIMGYKKILLQTIYESSTQDEEDETAQRNTTKPPPHATLTSQEYEREEQPADEKMEHTPEGEQGRRQEYGYEDSNECERDDHTESENDDTPEHERKDPPADGRRGIQEKQREVEPTTQQQSNKTPPPRYRIGSQMAEEIVNETELKAKAEKSAQHATLLHLGINMERPLTHPQPLGQREVCTDVLGTRPYRKQRLRVATINIQHIHHKTRDEKLRHLTALHTIYDTDYSIITELAATDEEMKKCNRDLFKMGMTTWYSVTPDQDQQQHRETGNSTNTTRKGGIAVLMTMDTARLHNETYGKMQILEKGRTIALPMRNRGKPLTIIGTYMQAAPYIATTTQKSTPNIKTNNEAAIETARRITGQVKKLKEAGHEVLLAGDFNIAIRGEDEGTRQYTFPKQAVDIREQIRKLQLYDLHQTTHPYTNPQSTHYHGNNISSTSHAKIDYIMGTKNIREATTGATTNTQPIESRITDHAYLIAEIEMQQLNNTTKPHQPTSAPKPRVIIGAGSGHTKYAQFRKELERTDDNGNNISEYGKIFNNATFSTGQGHEHNGNKPPTFEELPRFMEQFTEAYWASAKKAKILSDSKINPETTHRAEVDHDDNLTATLRNMTEIQGQLRSMINKLSSRQETTYEQQKQKRKKPQQTSTNHHHQQRHHGIAKTQFRAVDIIHENRHIFQRIAKMEQTLNPNNTKDPNNATSLRNLHFWENAEKITQVTQECETKESEGPILQWARVMRTNAGYAINKINNELTKKNRIDRETARQQHLTTSIGEFFRNMNPKKSGGYYHTTAYVKKHVPDNNKNTIDDTSADREDEEEIRDIIDNADLFDVEDGYETVTSEEGMQEAIREQWEGIYAGNKKPKEDHPLFEKIFKNRATEAQRNDLKDVMRDATMEELHDALKACKDRSAVGHDRSAYAPIKRGNTAIHQGMLAIINSCIRQRDIPEAWRHARIILLPKDENRPSSAVDNHRPVSLVSCHLKILERILAARMIKPIEEHGGLPETQFGGRPKRGTAQPLNILADLIEDANATGKPLYATAFDFAKCFDSVQFILIERGLIAQGMPDSFLQFYRNTCQRRTAAFVTGTGDTKPIDIKSSCFQGTVLSGLLFNIATAGMNTIINELPGARIPNSGTTDQFTLTGMNFCDDTMIVTNTLADAQTAATMMWELADVMGMTLHEKKTQLLVAGKTTGKESIWVGPAGAIRDPTRATEIKQLPSDHAMKYLGVLFRGDGKWTATERMLENKIEREILHMGTQNLTAEMAATYVRQLIIPRILHAGSIAYLSDKYVRNIDVRIREAVKKAMGLRRTTANAALYDNRVGAGIQSLRDRLDEAKITDWTLRMEQDGETIEGTTATARLQQTMEQLGMSTKALMNLEYIQEGQLIAWPQRTNSRTEDVLRAVARRGIGISRKLFTTTLTPDTGRVFTTDAIPWGEMTSTLPQFLPHHRHPETFLQDKVSETTQGRKIHKSLKDRTQIRHGMETISQEDYKKLQQLISEQHEAIQQLPPMNGRQGTTGHHSRGRIKPGDLVLWDIDISDGRYSALYGIVKKTTTPHIQHKSKDTGVKTIKNSSEKVSTWKRTTVEHDSASEEEEATGVETYGQDQEYEGDEDEDNNATKRDDRTQDRYSEHDETSNDDDEDTRDRGDNGDEEDKDETRHEWYNEETHTQDKRNEDEDSTTEKQDESTQESSEPETDDDDEAEAIDEEKMNSNEQDFDQNNAEDENTIENEGRQKAEETQDQNNESNDEGKTSEHSEKWTTREACIVEWVTEQHLREEYQYDHIAPLYPVWIPELTTIIDAKKKKLELHEVARQQGAEYREEIDNLIAVNGKAVEKGVHVAWYYSKDTLQQARSILKNRMQDNDIIQAYIFDSSPSTGTPDTAATFMMDIQYLRNEQIGTNEAAQRMRATRMHSNSKGSILKHWTEKDDRKRPGKTKTRQVTRTRKAIIEELRHYLQYNATHVPIESQQYAWKVLDLIEQADVNKELPPQHEDDMNTHPTTNKPPPFPLLPRWERPEFDLNKFREDWLQEHGCTETVNMTQRIERRQTDHHIGIDGSYYEHTSSPHEATVGGIVKERPQGSGTAAIAIVENGGDEDINAMKQVTKLGAGERGIHAEGSVMSSTFTEQTGAIMAALTVPTKYDNLINVTQDNKGAIQTMERGKYKMTTQDAMKASNSCQAILARCAQRWRMHDGGTPLQISHVKGHADDKKTKDSDPPLTPAEIANIRADKICLVTYDNNHTIEEGTKPISDKERKDKLQLQRHRQQLQSEPDEDQRRIRYDRNKKRTTTTRPHQTVIEEPTMGLHLPCGITNNGKSTIKRTYYNEQNIATILKSQRQMRWQHELSKRTTHGALSTHQWDEQWLAASRRGEQTPQIQRMLQKAKTMTIPTLTERVRLAPDTPGYPESTEATCIYCDTRANWTSDDDNTELAQEAANEPPLATMAHLLQCPHHKAKRDQCQNQIMKSINDRINEANPDRNMQNVHWNDNDMKWMNMEDHSKEQITAWTNRSTTDPKNQIEPQGNHNKHTPTQLLSVTNVIGTWAGFPPRGLRQKLVKCCMNETEALTTWKKTILPRIAETLHDMVKEQIDDEEEWAHNRNENNSNIHPSYTRRHWIDNEKALQAAWTRVLHDRDANEVKAAADKTYEDHIVEGINDITDWVDIDEIRNPQTREAMSLLLKNHQEWGYLAYRHSQVTAARNQPTNMDEWYEGW